MTNGLIILVAALWTAAANFFAFRPEATGHPATVALFLLSPAPLAAFAAFRAHRDGVLGEWLLPRVGDPTKGILLAMLAYAAAALTSFALFKAETPRGVMLVRLYLQFGDPGELRRATFASTALILLVVLVQELTWRGLVTSLFSEIVGSRRGWIASGLCYALTLVPTMWALRVPPAVGALNPVLVLFFGVVGFGSSFAQRWGGGRLFFVILGQVLYLWSLLLLYPLWRLR